MQTQFILVLGENPDALRPHEVHYHMPKYLRGSTGNSYLQGLKLRDALAKTAVPDLKPKEWHFLDHRVERRYKKLRKITDQYLWKNYKGTKSGPVTDSFKTNNFP